MTADAPPRSLLAVYAHPDDPQVSSGGTIAAWADAGTDVHLLILTRGEKGSTDAAASPEELATVRAEELRAAADANGVADLVQWKLPDGEVENTLELRGRLVELIRRVCPDAVMTHDPTAVFFGNAYLNHHDHRTVGWATLDACAPAAASPLYFPDLGAPHQVTELYLSGTHEADTFVDIGSVLDTKVRALCCHRTQVGEREDLVRDFVTARAAEAGELAAVSHAEAFRRIRFA